ncbi:MAG: aminoacyl-tRNA hydrolase [Cytophagaceae bacterium]|nr:aminoacyl-tRNA hydrolase [Cytophagaceae bacterium]|tara:strand:- start:42636 stop:43268 length:633 start_codon:yes stop_codon:yes gene_type:complete
MLAFFGRLFKSKKPSESTTATPMKKYLITGLGNIGPKYHNTRHNIGFQVLDAFAEANQLTWETEKLGDVAHTKIKGRPITLLKPNTYMNLSGKAVRYWLTKEKVDIGNLLVITDDLNLDFGTIRLKGKGSDGGHNGLKDIQAQLNTTSYPRFRFGIGDRFSKGKQVDFVLGEWSMDEALDLPERLETSCKIIESFVGAGLSSTMNTFNGK